MIRKLELYFHTLRYLKPIQVCYRVYYIFLNRFFSEKGIVSELNKKYVHIDFGFRHLSSSYKGNLKFNFLNIEHQFVDNVNWEFEEYGKLWLYNLCYFEFLNSEISKKEGMELITSFIKNFSQLKTSKDAYPTSLRIINWIRFISKHQIRDSKIIDHLYRQVELLSKKIEYHLLGNHLLENGFALYMAGVFFQKKQFLKKGESILNSQIEEQFLEDGAHFELSPMYHQILMFRIFECIDSQKSKEDKFIRVLQRKSSSLLGWLTQISFKNGDIPLLNDSSKGIAPTTSELVEIASYLKIKETDQLLSDSAYRKYALGKYECIVDVGNIKANYQPGHTHSDIFNFIVYVNNAPFVVDTGTSTYEKNDRRELERATRSHNTVTINGQNQSDVWGGFRVGKRAKTKIELDEISQIVASHDGYVTKHQRYWSFNDDCIYIIDELEDEKIEAEAHFHFHPNIKVEISNNVVHTSLGSLFFENDIEIKFSKYLYAESFNLLTESIKATVKFKRTLKTKIFIQ